MLDIKRIIENRTEVEANLLKRGKSFDLKVLLDLDESRKKIILETENKKRIRNEASKKIGLLKSKGENPEEIMEEMRLLGDEISVLDKELKLVEENIKGELSVLPNLLLDSVPEGEDETFNLEVRRFGEVRAFSFAPKDHQDLGVALGIMDFERATKVTASKFVFMKGLGARLERALASYMIDFHVKNGYTEVFCPFVANSDSFFGTGQLPKFGEDMFKVEGEDFYLIPTAEVPLTNYYRDEIINGEELPIRICGFTPCFRSEAGAAGRDTKGLIRMHQFSKVEMVNFVKPEDGVKALEEITAEAEGILKELGLPYRVVDLCGGDIGFGSAKTYDIEVYLPSYQGYKEISSCSLYTDFQARRSRIRYRDEKGKKNLLYTLNGSGLAIGRTIAAILENYQNEDGSITIPEALVPYMGTDDIK
ncbi:MAG: serine--tRNA ligase [Fusobacteria bacterium]|nr:serine--tRNA ligase [Fusobacteriota bacterium]